MLTSDLPTDFARSQIRSPSACYSAFLSAFLKSSIVLKRSSVPGMRTLCFGGWNLSPSNAFGPILSCGALPGFACVADHVAHRSRQATRGYTRQPAARWAENGTLSIEGSTHRAVVPEHGHRIGAEPPFFQDSPCKHCPERRLHSTHERRELHLLMGCQGHFRAISMIFIHPSDDVTTTTKRPRTVKDSAIGQSSG